MYNEGIRTFKAGEALAARRRVKIEAATETDPPEVVYADAGEDAVGVTEYAVADGAMVSVKLLNFSGTFEIECLVDSAIARGTVLYAGDHGMVTDASSGSAVGVSMVAGADNQHIEVVMWSLKSTTAATVSIADAGDIITGATVEAALAEIFTHIQSAQSHMPVALGAITLEDGTYLTKQATTVTGIAQIGDKEQVIMIPVNAGAGEEALGFNIPVPQNLDDSADILVHVLASKSADLDVLTLDCEVFPCGVGDLQNADIQDTAAQTVVEGGTELIFTCGADGVLAAPGTLTVILTQAGTNDGDAIYIHGVWIEYTGKTLTT